MAVSAGPIVIGQAGPIIDGEFLINDLTDTVSITDITPGGPTGRLNACAPSGESCFFSIASSQSVLPTSSFGGLEMVEPGSSNISDTLAQTDTGAISTFWSFQSDADNGTFLSPLGGTPAVITEDGTQQLAAVVVYGTTGMPTRSSSSRMWRFRSLPRECWRCSGLRGLAE